MAPIFTRAGYSLLDRADECGRYSVSIDTGERNRMPHLILTSGLNDKVAVKHKGGIGSCSFSLARVIKSSAFDIRRSAGPSGFMSSISA